MTPFHAPLRGVLFNISLTPFACAHVLRGIAHIVLSLNKNTMLAGNPGFCLLPFCYFLNRWNGFISSVLFYTHGWNRGLCSFLCWPVVRAALSVFSSIKVGQVCEVAKSDFYDSTLFVLSQTAGCLWCIFFSFTPALSKGAGEPANDIYCKEW